MYTQEEKKKFDAELKMKIEKANGTRTKRIITQNDVDEFMVIMIIVERVNPKAKEVRMYPYDAFVPNAYKYKCDTSVLVAIKQGDTWVYSCDKVDGKRSYGKGPRVTVNGKNWEYPRSNEAFLGG